MRAISESLRWKGLWNALSLQACYACAILHGTAAIAEEPRDAEDRSCGDVCVEILCSRYNKTFDLEKVRKDLKLDENGECSLESVANVLSQLGLIALPVKGDIDDVLKTKTPLVLHVKQSDSQVGNHFTVVLPGKTGDQLLSIEPIFSDRPFPVTRAMLEKSWTGVALQVKDPLENDEGIYWYSLFDLYLAGGLVMLFLFLLIRWAKPSNRTQIAVRLFFFLGIGVTAGCGDDTAQVSPTIEEPDEVTEIALGTIPMENNSAKAVFKWTNTTGHELTGLRLTPACHCVTVSSSKDTLSPGEKITFTCDIDIRDVKGHFGTGFILIAEQMDDPIPFIVRLFKPIAATVSPRTADFGQVRFGQVVRKRIQVDSVTGGVNDVIELVGCNRCDRVGVSLENAKSKRKVTRFANATKDSYVLSMVVDVVMKNQEGQGRFKEDLTLNISVGEETYPVNVLVAGDFKPQYHMIPSTLVLMGHEGEELLQEVYVRDGSTGEPAEIEKIICPDLRIEVVQTKEKGKAKISVKNNNMLDDFNTAIQVYVVGHPQAVELPIRVRSLGMSHPMLKLPAVSLE